MSENDVMNKTLSIPSISCGHCLKSIERELGFVDGVVYVSGDSGSKTVQVEYDNDGALDRARVALGEIGFAPDD